MERKSDRRADSNFCSRIGYWEFLDCLPIMKDTKSRSARIVKESKEIMVAQEKCRGKLISDGRILLSLDILLSFFMAIALEI